MLHRRKLVAAIVLVMIILSSVYVKTYADNKDKNITSQLDFPGEVIDNLKQELKSDDPGLKKSAIYISGLYKIQQMASPIRDFIQVEKDSSIRFVALLALYQIGNREALDACRVLCFADQSAKIRRVATAIVSELSAKSNEVYTFKHERK